MRTLNVEIGRISVVCVVELLQNMTEDSREKIVNILRQVN
jgi:hypothetical protein